MISEAARGPPPTSIILDMTDACEDPWQVRVLVAKKSTAPAIEWTSANLKALHALAQRELETGKRRPRHGSHRLPEDAKKSAAAGFYFHYQTARWIAKRRLQGSRGRFARHKTGVVEKGNAVIAAIESGANAEIEPVHEQAASQRTLTEFFAAKATA